MYWGRSNPNYNGNSGTENRLHQKCRIQGYPNKDWLSVCGMLSLQLKSKLARTKPSSRGLDIAASYFPRFLWPAGTQALAFPFWPARRIGGDSGIRLEYNASYGSFRGNSFLTARVSPLTATFWGYAQIKTENSSRTIKEVTLVVVSCFENQLDRKSMIVCQRCSLFIDEVKKSNIRK